MRRLLMTSLVLLAGCQNLAGPFQARPAVRVDDPRLSIEDQEKLGRDRLALPDPAPVPSGPDFGRPGIYNQR